ncbi:S-adenosylmethionine-dependent methyltransferase Rv2258c-like [Mya arenaria]|uniref:S-adenosylmethionine-dependent methyltransferase Rv2258c-like n=1 Tax=Mya arenaria TaxID=6604 RepID=UPI0022E8B202|nr:S-adenosylmethionine-dependent methyltransferase Rv2258c-like [Mya arenaria]XP_052792884.1 S-adenosylmethionine-dependent methyltransferase Rv2258c-like [Mya arenaria]XP_052792885.1 S-adenosylmethionine-dependent methyltransferase Rv2258c-like [Mya arenaria]XP_052792886.1 S-adenosylmethionine-dependent methyltransferase Rv2258c-like [Mya arenaria]
MAEENKSGMDPITFSKYLGGIYGGGGVMISVAIGHELGLFKAVCKEPGPFSLEAIAGKLKFKPRYTKEWLSTMVAAGILHQDRDSRLYTVPDGHKPALLRDTGLAPVLFALAARADLIKKCFQEDGPYGVSFADGPEWLKWFNGYRNQSAEHTVNSEIVPTWKKQSDIIPRLEKGIKVLDLGCGPGNLTNILAQRFPKSTFFGLDPSDDALEIAKRDTADRSLSNVTYEKGDAHKLPEHWTANFDMVLVFDVLHDLPNPKKALEQIRRALKPDGFLSLVDFGFHSDPVDNAGDMMAAFSYSVSNFMCLANSMLEEPHTGYGACWGREEIQKTVLEAGFKMNSESSLVIVKSKCFFYCTK